MVFFCPNPLEQHPLVVSAFWPSQAKDVDADFGWIWVKSQEKSLGSLWDHSLGSQQSFKLFLCSRICLLTSRQRSENPVQGLNIFLPSISLESSCSQKIPGFLATFFQGYSNLVFHHDLPRFGLSILLQFLPTLAAGPGLCLPKLEHYFSAEMTSWLKCCLKLLLSRPPSHPLLQSPLPAKLCSHLEPGRVA